MYLSAALAWLLAGLVLAGISFVVTRRRWAGPGGPARPLTSEELERQLFPNRQPGDGPPPPDAPAPETRSAVGSWGDGVHVGGGAANATSSAIHGRVALTPDSATDPPDVAGRAEAPRE